MFTDISTYRTGLKRCTW